MGLCKNLPCGGGNAGTTINYYKRYSLSVVDEANSAKLRQLFKSRCKICKCSLYCPFYFFPVRLKFFVVKRLKINCKLLKAVKAWVLSHGVQIPGERPGMDVFRLPEILRTMADPSPGLRFTGEPRRAHRKGAPTTLPLPRVTCS